MSVTVMAFDVATSTGVAYGLCGTTPQAETLSFRKGASQSARFAEALGQSAALLERWRPEIVVYEAPLGGTQHDTFLAGLAACVAGQTYRILEREPHSVVVSSVRKHFLGRAMSKADFPGLSQDQARARIKALVIQRCKLLGWQPRNDDEADAMALWDFGCATFGRAQAAPLGDLFVKRRSPR